ncbi:hypothetical protein SELMODRAFT_444176 [Selaginella moellendorffii]|uniref:BZIP domain-containing protein n=1 Tax=Selaginella moellendorffii TaxID=88036 RepID=D8S7L3_SELML|nr:basic leucine zipper 6 [Selaginella moellendorffii]XP_024519851.1 basic leucine zipper 6 [Selaginella moellendorffii]EFJ19775.1 hypothetical protein SELMODRAFT_444176 [Selaginella moellendorffii]|eukprot:XP_002979367.1 basic leucine zipper 6 [Selaginella moellendorffii]
MSSSQLGRSDKSSSRCVNWGHSMALNHLPPKSPAIPSSTSSSQPCVGPPYPGCVVRVPGYGAAAVAHHHRRSPSASFVPDVEPSWLEELLDSPKAPERPSRASHRRSASDSITFLEAPSNLRKIDDIAEEDECYFDREEQQLAAMFSDVVQISDGGWSQQDRRAPHPFRTFPGDLSYVGGSRMGNDAEQQHDNEQSQLQGDQSADSKRSKRQSAQRSRVRKLQYIHELEGNVSDLQNEVSGLSTQVALLEHQRLALHLDNAALKQNVAGLAQDARIKDAHNEALKKEIQRLRFLKQQQQRLRQQLALASSAAGNNVETTTTTTTTTTKHVRRASAGSVQDLGSSAAADVLDYSFVKFVEKTDSPVLRSSCTMAGNGKSLEVGASRLSGAPPGFIVHNHL